LLELQFGSHRGKFAQTSFGLHRMFDSEKGLIDNPAKKLVCQPTLAWDAELADRPLRAK